MDVYLWGTGKNCEKVLGNIRYGNNRLLGIVDNNPELWGRTFQGIPVYGPDDIDRGADYMILTMTNYDALLYQIGQMGIPLEKVICYFGQENCWEKYQDILDVKGWKIDLLEHRIEGLERQLRLRLDNVGYEVADKMKQGCYRFPIIRDSGVAVRRIVEEGCSMIRFGDGEFEIMAGNERPIFQKYDEMLARRLREIIRTDDDNILIGIANNYGCLDQYTEETADGIRDYMTERVRHFHWSVLKENKVYYDAYMFKCYMPFRDKEGTLQRIGLIKRIWEGRRVLVIEGDKTRTGVGNGLFDNAEQVRRILGPTQNAFACLEEIRREVWKTPRDWLVVCVLGPAGKVLAYDLIQEGYQVVDIGQVDMDYEWYLAGKGKRVPIPGKYVSQLPPTDVADVQDAVYERQILARIARMSGGKDKQDGKDRECGFG